MRHLVREDVLGAATSEFPSEGNGSELLPLSAGRLLLRLWGRLPPGWAGALSLALAGAEVSVVRGFARRSGPGRWVAELTIEPQGRLDPESLDFFALASTPAAEAERQPIVLDDFSVMRGPDAGLLLEVKGIDRVGFLASLLHLLAGLSLFPEEMSIHTRGPLALDRLRLHGVSGRAPTEEAQRALETLLRDFLQKDRRLGSSSARSRP